MYYHRVSLCLTGFEHLPAVLFSGSCDSVVLPGVSPIKQKQEVIPVPLPVPTPVPVPVPTPVDVPVGGATSSTDVVDVTFGGAKHRALCDLVTPTVLEHVVAIRAGMDQHLLSRYWQSGPTYQVWLALNRTSEPALSVHSRV